MTFDLDDFLKKSHKAQASDIHLNCDKAPSLRINGEIYKIASSTITQEDISKILDSTLPDEYKKKIGELQDIDYVYEIKGTSRYRVNYCKDICGGKLTFRTIPYYIKNLKELSLPDYLADYANFSNGIVFITGATGSGKSTTLASLIEIINQNHKRHIVTIEDPVEFVYEDKKSIITQRSLDIDVSDFKTGIKYALRQDPDVILIGEIRDKETLLSAIEASETGHLVFSTLHTNGTAASINRLKGFIKETGQEQFMQRLASCIRGIIHQQLVPTTENGALTPAIEILTFTSTVIDYIKEGKLDDVYQLMQRSKQSNISTMNNSLYKLYKAGKITKETAYEFSLEKNEMDQRLRGMYQDSSLDESIL
ncbi:MAG: PilT/PilU family type 4a pilus ATPase [Candidatus Gastranaerophilales bacterium]|nr:PilT/PilU family type 4a pilus ATPase [Candidatus Gastranaerophilales bacterium]